MTQAKVKFTTRIWQYWSRVISPLTRSALRVPLDLSIRLTTGTLVRTTVVADISTALFADCAVRAIRPKPTSRSGNKEQILFPVQQICI
jgi:hypothetical protein